MKKLILILILLIGTLQVHAVLKEKDLPQTLQILRTELTDYHRELSDQIEMNKIQREQIRDQLISIMSQSKLADALFAETRVCVRSHLCMS